MAGVTSDYDSAPERYRLGMAVTRRHSSESLYAEVAARLTVLGARRVLDVGCADGVLRSAVSPGPLVVGLDTAAALLRAHPPPVVRADAAHLPFPDASFDAVTALNVLYHLPEPGQAVREARRVLRAGGTLLASAIARDDSPELWPFWRRPATSFDAEDAPAVLGEAFGRVAVHRWDAPLLTLPDAAAVRDYLLGRQAPSDAAARAARAVRTPLPVTERGALLVASTDRT
ncbi:class I SAM-dependent methyltransferase [Geodermatophilus sp. URMC 61]|uniref:class I SAM-dependent methyltransferase n=1 Tax=Geodermatophilus sp. URMC 61 TaxID=3423411 RepID=UPI00406CC59E